MCCIDIATHMGANKVFTCRTSAYLDYYLNNSPKKQGKHTGIGYEMEM